MASKIERIYVTDVDDNGEPLGGLFAVSDTKLWRVELAPGAVYISADYERRYLGEIPVEDDS